MTRKKYVETKLCLRLGCDVDVNMAETYQCLCIETLVLVFVYCVYDKDET